MFRQENLDKNQLNLVIKCADLLLIYLNQDETVDKIKQENQPGASSATIQEVIMEQAENLGFSSEKKRLVFKI